MTIKNETTHHDATRFKEIARLVESMLGDGDYPSWRDVMGKVYKTLAEAETRETETRGAEPLIKDEKIRKAVRAWAEANDIEEASIQNNYCLAGKEDEDVTIIFASPIFKDIDDTDFHAIAELCGEDEE